MLLKIEKKGLNMPLKIGEKNKIVNKPLKLKKKKQQ